MLLALARARGPQGGPTTIIINFIFTTTIITITIINIFIIIPIVCIVTTMITMTITTIITATTIIITIISSCMFTATMIIIIIIITTDPLRRSTAGFSTAGVCKKKHLRRIMHDGSGRLNQLLFLVL